MKNGVDFATNNGKTVVAGINKDGNLCVFGEGSIETASLPTPEVEEGKKFDGWSETENGEVITATSVTANKGLYAKVSEIEPEQTTSKITYNLNGGKLEGSTTEQVEKEYTIGNEISLPIPTKAGYTFKCWCVDEELTVRLVPETANNKYTPSKNNVTVYAKYTSRKVSSIKVKAPSKLEYIKGSELDLTGAKLTVTFDNGETSEIDITAQMVSGYNKTMTGEQTITVTYEGKTDTFKVTVKDLEVTIKNNLKHSDIDGTTYIITEKGTKAEELLKDTELNTQDYNLIIKDSSSKTLSDKDTLKTNQTMAIDGLNENLKMVVVVRGDLNSDGKVDIRDIVKLNNYRINKAESEKNWSNDEKVAFKALSNSNITSTDIAQVVLRDIAILNNCRLK